MGLVGVEQCERVQSYDFVLSILREVHIGQMTMHISSYDIEVSLNEVVVCIKIYEHNSLCIPSYC